LRLLRPPSPFMPAQPIAAVADNLTSQVYSSPDLLESSISNTTKIWSNR